ncbi:RCC1 domain-containing protein [Paenibacillus puerhi]|uniref:hypothetical protein n=1 Tax=Paenibacillus puerhi TaxID=2692622 RepID=UPI00135A0CC2|nr:hypothetical protein [Paenibacillus puerhi]
MFRKVVQAAIRYKVAATGVLALVLLVSVVISSWPGRKEGGTLANGTKTPATSLVPTGSPTTSAITELAATPTPSQASNGKPLFNYAACPPHVTWYPANAAASGFTLVEAPKGMPLEGIRLISTGHMFDAAGYGMEYGASYALADNGTIYRWGLTGWGNGSETNAFPTKVKGLPAGEKVVQLDGRFVLMQSGTLYDLNAEGGPKPIQGLPKGNAIAQSDDVSVYVLASDGSLTLYSLHGQDGNPVVSKVKADFKAASVTSGPFITLASDQSGKVWVLQGLFSSSPDSLPHLLELPDKEKVQRINATMSPQVPAYILSDRGKWFSLNMEGKLTLADVPTGAVQVTAMEMITVALKADGTVRGWESE